VRRAALAAIESKVDYTDLVEAVVKLYSVSCDIQKLQASNAREHAPVFFRQQTDELRRNLQVYVDTYASLREKSRSAADALNSMLGSVDPLFIWYAAHQLGCEHIRQATEQAARTRYARKAWATVYDEKFKELRQWMTT
jgi:hypothetical protein